MHLIGKHKNEIKKIYKKRNKNYLKKQRKNMLEMSTRYKRTSNGTLLFLRQLLFNVRHVALHNVLALLANIA